MDSSSVLMAVLTANQKIRIYEGTRVHVSERGFLLFFIQPLIQPLARIKSCTRLGGLHLVSRLHFSYHRELPLFAPNLACALTDLICCQDINQKTLSLLTSQPIVHKILPSVARFSSADLDRLYRSSGQVQDCFCIAI